MVEETKAKSKKTGNDKKIEITKWLLLKNLN